MRELASFYLKTQFNLEIQSAKRDIFLVQMYEALYLPQVKIVLTLKFGHNTLLSSYCKVENIPLHVISKSKGYKCTANMYRQTFIFHTQIDFCLKTFVWYVFVYFRPSDYNLGYKFKRYFKYLLHFAHFLSANSPNGGAYS